MSVNGDENGAERRQEEMKKNGVARSRQGTDRDGHGMDRDGHEVDASRQLPFFLKVCEKIDEILGYKLGAMEKSGQLRERNLAKKELAALLGLSQRTIQRWVNDPEEWLPHDRYSDRGLRFNLEEVREAARRQCANKRKNKQERKEDPQ